MPSRENQDTGDEVQATVYSDNTIPWGLCQYQNHFLRSSEQNSTDNAMLNKFNKSLEKLRKDKSKYVQSRANQNWQLMNKQDFMDN